MSNKRYRLVWNFNLLCYCGEAILGVAVNKTNVTNIWKLSSTIQLALNKHKNCLIKYNKMFGLVGYKWIYPAEGRPWRSPRKISVTIGPDRKKKMYKKLLKGHQELVRLIKWQDEGT